MKGWYVSLLALVAGYGAVLAQAQNTVKPAIVYAIGGKFDKSFNEGVSNGAKKFKAETRHRRRRFRDRRTRRSASRRCAGSPSGGNDPIIAVGFSQAAALEKVAKEFPNTQFAIIDSVVDLPNVQSVVFKEQEGSFLVGMLAAHGVEDRQGRLRRRHGHPADPQVRSAATSRASSTPIPRPR